MIPIAKETLVEKFAKRPMLRIIRLDWLPAVAAQIAEYPLPFNALGGIAASPDGALWFAGNGKIGRISTAGVITQYPIPTPPVQIGSAQLSATGAVDGFAVFHQIPTAQEAVIPMETRSASSYLLALSYMDTAV